MYAVWVVLPWDQLQIAGPNACAGQRVNMVGERVPIGFVPVFASEGDAEAFRDAGGPRTRTADITPLSKREGA